MSRLGYILAASLRFNVPAEDVHIPSQAEPSVLLLRQQGADLLVRLADAEGNVTPLSIPGHRAGILVVVVHENEDIYLDLSTVYKDGPDCFCDMTRLTVSEDSTDWAVAQILQAAEHKFANGDRGAIQEASLLLDETAGIPTALPLISDAADFMSALIAYQRFDFSKAEQRLDLISEFWLSEPDLMAAMDWARGALALERYDAARSLVYLERALMTVDQHRETHPWLSIDEIEIRLFMALVLMRLGRSDEGVGQLDYGLKRAKELGSAVLEGKIRNNYSGYFELYTRDAAVMFPENYQRSIDELEQALELLSEAEEVTTRVSILGNLGRMSVIAGDLGQSQLYYQQAIALNNTCHHEVLSGYHYAQLGRLYLLLGDLKRALNFVRHAFDARKRAGALLIAAKDSITLSSIYRELGDIQNAVKFGQEAVDFLSKHGTADDQAQSLAELAFALIEANRPDAALEVSAKAMAFADEISFPWLLVDVHLSRARSFQIAGKDEAGSQFSLAAALATDSGLIPSAVPTLLAASEFHQKHDAELANALISTAMEIVEGVRGQLDSTRLGPNFANKNHAVYVQAAMLALDDYRAEPIDENLIEAICRLERGRTYSLLAERHAEIDEDDETTSIKRQLNVLTHRRVNGDSDPELIRRYEECIEALSARGYGSDLSVGFDQFSMSDLQARLNDDVAILYYILGDTRAYVIRILNDGLELFSLGELQLDNEAVAELTSVRSPGTPAEKLTKLSSMFLPDDVVDTNRVQNIYVVSHGILEQIPFSALSFQTTSEPMPVVTCCSVQLFRSLVSIEHSIVEVPNGFEIAVMADPAFNSAEIRSVVETTPGYRNWADSLRRLPWTAEEANHIQQVYGKESTLLYTGAAANRKNLFCEEVKNAKILHIASHGFFSSALEDVVGVALSPSDNDDNGFVALTDFLGEKFRNQLVVISGCETALGRNLQGEGAMSIGRAFVARGASMVISTLWPVADRASSVFMREFYLSLTRNGGNPAEALRTAQTCLRETPRFDHPSYWAAYVLHTTRLDCRLDT